MAERLKRASFARIAVGMAALAFPLFAVGTAQAAIGGAPAESTTAAPDLVSATAIDGTDVDYCFDKQINNSGFAAADFSIKGYRSGRSVNSTGAALELIAGTNNQCVRATFSGAAIGDIGQYTVASITADAVETVGLVPNANADSTTLTVPSSLSPTHNGTTGFTVGPDLQSVTVDATSNTVTYVEDQQVGTTVAAGDFYLETPGALFCGGTGAVGGSNTVTVVFPAGCNVQVATEAGQIPGAVTAAADPGRPNAPETVVIPGKSATTSAPDLTAAALSTTNAGVMNFTFDKTVTPLVAADFKAVLSTGLVVSGTATTATPGPTAGTTTVQVTFPSLSTYNEYVVYGAVYPGAVADSSLLSNTNFYAGAPAGDNAGAFARGFTTGPDATSAVESKSTGLVSITLDQRAFSYNAADPIQLLDGVGGNIIATAPASAVGLPTLAAGPETITALFSPAQVATGTNLSIAAGALTSAPAPGPAQSSVVQILSTTSSATLLHRAVEARSHHMSKRAFKAHQAAVRKQEKRLLKNMERTLHHTI